SSCLDSGLCDPLETAPCSEVEATHITATLEPGAIERGRFNEDQIGMTDRIHLEFLCYDSPNDEATAAPCSGTLTFVTTIHQPECRDDSDCATDEECNLASGRCEVLTGLQTGCQTSAGNSTLMGLIWLLFGLGALALVRSCVRRA
ncbi:MAG: hypothetical protein KC561_03870, partial [Myxococcales bacterium]|nr:hypothetical protein [Myxococcales bacterium]